MHATSLATSGDCTGRLLACGLLRIRNSQPYRSHSAASTYAAHRLFLARRRYGSRQGQTTEFTLEITGGDASAEPAWTCASADTTIASAARTASGCSATGTGTGTTTIAATVTRGALTATASASLRVTPPPLTASLSPAADTVQTGQTAQFTLEITGGDAQRRTGLDVRFG